MRKLNIHIPSVRMDDGEDIGDPDGTDSGHVTSVMSAPLFPDIHRAQTKLKNNTIHVDVKYSGREGVCGESSKGDEAGSSLSERASESSRNSG